MESTSRTMEDALAEIEYLKAVIQNRVGISYDGMWQRMKQISVKNNIAEILSFAVNYEYGLALQ